MINIDDIMDYEFYDKKNIEQIETNSTDHPSFTNENDFDDYLMRGGDENEIPVIEIYLKDGSDYCRITKADVTAMAKHFDII